MFPILFRIGPLTLHTYGLLVAAGFVAAFTLARREFDRRGISKEVLDRMIIFIMLSALVGARLFYFVLVDRAAFSSDPLSFFRIWEGGLVYFGGFLFGLLALFIYSYYKELSFWTVAAALTAPVLLGQSIGRLGCFAAGCCYGRETHSGFGVTFTHPESLAKLDVPLHPTQLYMAMGNFLLFLGAIYLSKKKPTESRLVVYYLLGYGVFRFFIEFLRDDRRGQMILFLSPGQWIAIILILSGLALWFHVRKTQKI